MSCKKMVVLTILFMTILIFSPLLWAATEKETVSLWRVSGRSETSLEWKESNDPNTTLNEDTSFRQELSLSATRRLEGGSMGLSLRGRGTNDRQVDAQDARLLYLNAFFRREEIQAELGDVAASYNPMVLSAALKGSKVEYGRSRQEGWNVSAITGIQKAGWEELYGDNDREAVDRYVAGLETTGKFGPGQEISFAASAVRDHVNRDFRQTGFDPLPPGEAVTTGLQWNWRFNRYLQTRGEGAFTRSEENTRSESGPSESGAVRLRLLTSPLPRSLRMNFLYERVEPGFAPLAGSAPRDTERVESDTTWMLSQEFKARLTLKNRHDNLDRQLSGTLETNEGVLDLNWRPRWVKRGDLNLRTQRKDSKGRGTEQKLSIGELGADFRTASGWRYGLRWIFTDIEDRTAGAEDQQIHTLRGTFGWNRRIGDDHTWRATIRLDANRIDRKSGDQNALGGGLDLGYDAGTHWSADLSAATRNTYRDRSEDNEYRAYEIRGNYHPGGDRSRAIRISAGRREYDNEKGQDTREHVAKLSYLFGF